MLLASLLGTLPQWLTVLALIGGGWLVTKGSAGPALGYEREANKTLRERCSELERELKAALVEVATLQARTDLAPMQSAIMERLTAHEERAQERFERTTEVLGLIADKLNPDGSTRYLVSGGWRRSLPLPLSIGECHEIAP